MDDYQVCRYPGWHRHMTLAMAAHAWLSVLRARQLDTETAETDPPAPFTAVSRSDDIHRVSKARHISGSGALSGAVVPVVAAG